MTDLSGVEQLPQPDPRGWLALRYLPPEIQNLEDATAAADVDRHRFGTYRASGTWNITDPDELAKVMARARTVLTKAGMHAPRTFPRPATTTERTLLEHLGYELPAELLTAVAYPTYGIRNRRWPQLEKSQEES
jgi:hypothetical protein